MPFPITRLRHAARLLRSHDARVDALHEWRRQRAGEPPLPSPPVRSVLFLCHGNICRSPFAAALLTGRRPDLAVRSAGLAAGTDAPADPTAAKVAGEYGVALDAHRSRPVDAAELATTDLVFVMQAHQAERTRALAGDPRAAARIYLLGDFLDSPPFGLLDPWGLPEPVFRQVFGRIEGAVSRVAALLPATPA